MMMMMENITACTQTMANRNIYVADDEIGVRLSVTDLLEDLGYNVWSFSSGTDLLSVLADIEPGCLLLDIQMPGMTGLEVMEELRRRDCRWPVIVMTGHGDVPKAVQAMKLGAFEFIEKPFDPDSLQPALNRGFARWDEQRAECEARRVARDQLSVLSPREHSVLQELIQGHQNKIVAHKLGLSVRTVEMHRANLLGKLGLRTPQEAVALVMRAQDGFSGYTASQG